MAPEEDKQKIDILLWTINIILDSNVTFKYLTVALLTMFIQPRI